MRIGARVACKGCPTPAILNHGQRLVASAKLPPDRAPRRRQAVRLRSNTDRGGAGGQRPAHPGPRLRRRGARVHTRRQRPRRQAHRKVPLADLRLRRKLRPRRGTIWCDDGRVLRGKQAPLQQPPMRARRGPARRRVLRLLVLRRRHRRGETSPRAPRAALQHQLGRVVERNPLRDHRAVLVLRRGAPTGGPHEEGRELRLRELPRETHRRKGGVQDNVRGQCEGLRSDLAAPVPDTLPAADPIYYRFYLCLSVRGPAPLRGSFRGLEGSRRPHLCGNQISGAPRHRRDITPILTG